MSSSKNTTRKKGRLSQLPEILEYCTLANPFQDGKGNRCYMNATLQLLYSIPELKTFLLEPLPTLDSISYKKEEKDCNDTRIRNKNTLEALGTLFKAMIQHKGSNPIDTQKIKLGQTTVYDILLESAGTIKDDRGDMRSELGEGKVADADSFLSKILEVFTCLHRIKEINTVYESLEYDDIDTYKCKDTMKWSSGMEVKSTKLSLPISERTTSIQDALTEYMEEESFLESPVNVEACLGKEAIAKKHVIKLKDATKTILITLTRNSFNKETGEQGKLENPIEPTNQIQIDSAVFELQGVIRHTGGTGGGHYTYQIYKDSIPVVNLNDSKKFPTKKSDLESVKNAIKTEGYVFLYRRVSNNKVLNVSPDNKIYTNIWKECMSAFESILINPKNALDSLKNLPTKLELLTAYKNYIELLYTKEHPTISTQAAFFDKLEAIREFYARALILVCCMDKEIQSPITNTLSEYSISSDAKLGPYEMPFLVIPLIYKMASWEWSTYYMNSVFKRLEISDPRKLPLHLQNLLTNEKGQDIFLNYPKSLLMDYSMFYPYRLSLSGK